MRTELPLLQKDSAYHLDEKRTRNGNPPVNEHLKI